MADTHAAESSESFRSRRLSITRMGADNSHLRGASIADKQLLERLRHDLVLSEGRLVESGGSASQQISLFEDVSGSKENPFHNYTPERPLARAIRNLKIYRHPYAMLKFLATTGERTLVTEHVVGSLAAHRHADELRTCLGIKNILSALIFLVETAGVRHLNVAPESVFVTANGTWKLAGAEHIHASVTPELLAKSRAHRSPASVDPAESDGTGLEQFAFASLCEATLTKESAVPFAGDFLAYCRTHLKHKNASLRPSLSAVQLHSFFAHDFIVIHAFLSELPLKTPAAKQEFFRGLNERLKRFDEDVVGGQLSELLLSRLVLLDPAAQFHLLPCLLRPQNLEEDDEDSTSEYLFTASAFAKFMVPRLKQVYRVLDVQIRLVLLEFFNLYAGAFTKEELVDEILPQLLLGIRDTNDLLVTKTLLCLADLIPIIGANQVIGKNRQKIFADGRPQQTELWTSMDHNIPRSITPINTMSVDILSSSPVDHVDVSEHTEVADPAISDTEQRLEQGDVTDTEVEWNWEDQEQEQEPEPVKAPQPVTLTRPKIDDNIDDLDIKNKKLTKVADEAEDFFSDFGMTPTFNAATVVTTPVSETKSVADRLQMSMVGEINENEGWGDDANWDEQDEL